MHVGFGPEHEGQQEEADLDGRYREDIPLEDFVVADDVHCRHVDAEVVLDGLGQVEEGVVPEEGHAARFPHADQRKDQGQTAEGEVPPEVGLVEEESPPSADLGCIGLSIHFGLILRNRIQSSNEFCQNRAIILFDHLLQLKTGSRAPP